MLGHILFRLFTILSILTVYSQEPVFKQFGVADGLPGTETYNLYQDASGYVWVFTEYGIVKHNGSRFVPTCTNIPFKESIVYHLTKSPSGEIFFLNSRANVYLLKNDSAFQVEGIDAISSNILIHNKIPMNLYIDDFNKIWISIFEQSYSVSARNYTVQGQHLPIKNHLSIPRESKYDFHFERKSQNGTIFFKLLNSKNIIQTYHTRSQWDYSRSYARSHNNNLYLGYYDTLQVFKNNTLVRTVKLNGPLISMEMDSEGHIWLSIENEGVYEFDTDLNLIGQYLKGNTIHDILFDSKGGIWLATLDEGVFYCRNRSIKSYHTVDGLNERINMLKVVDNKLFIGTTQGKLYVKEKGVIKTIDLQNQKLRIRDIIFFKNQYYVATNEPVFQLSSDMKTFKSNDQFPWAYGFVNHKNELFFTAGTNVFKKNKGKNELIKQTTAFRSTGLLNRSGKELLAYSKNGIRVIGKDLPIPKYLLTWKEKNISKLKMDKYGNLWICTKGDGLYCLTKQNKKIKYKGVPSKVINSISFMNDTIVLLATNKGAYATTLSNINVPSLWILLLDEEVLDIESFENDLYLATKSGLIEINPKNIFKTVCYPFYLKSIISEGKKVPFGTKHFSYYQDELYFNFDILSFGLPIKLKYRLNGPSKLLGEMEVTQLHLQNLAPGKYTLFVYMLPNNTRDKKQVFKYEFFIHPAFWQTGWFISLVVLIIIGSFLFVFYRINEKNRRKHQIEKQLNEYRLTALKSQVNPHFMSNSLVAIQRLILKNDVQTANRYLVKFSLLIRYLLDYSDKSSTPLKSELTLIDLYVELEQLRFSNRFTFQKVIDPSIDLSNVYIPTLIMQPFIENAIWHGLLGLSGERDPELVLKISIEEKTLFLIITDNGIGRRPKKQTIPLKKSKGISLITNRINYLNRLYQTKKANILYSDSIDENGTPNGTSVTIVFPFELLDKLKEEEREDEKYYN